MNQSTTLRMVKTMLVAPVCFLVACASTHNHRTDGFNPGGGGFSDIEIRPGLYRLAATSNLALWPTFSAARETWKMRAAQLCGNEGFDEIDQDYSAGGHSTPVIQVRPGGPMVQGSLYNAQVAGYVLCKKSGISVSEAVRFLQRRDADEKNKLIESRRVELASLGGANCSDAPSSADTLYRKGKLLLSLDRYREAVTCFERAQEQGPETGVYNDACYSLGQMYESGVGVDRDLATAKSWYKKAGL